MCVSPKDVAFYSGYSSVPTSLGIPVGLLFNIYSLLEVTMALNYIHLCSVNSFKKLTSDPLGP